jgi:hypothetical protein
MSKGNKRAGREARKPKAADKRAKGPPRYMTAAAPPAKPFARPPKKT